MRRPVSRFLSRSVLPWAVAASTVFAPGCDEVAVDPGVDETEAPLTDLDALLAEAPDKDKLPDEPKSDQTYPAKFDLASTQTPVRNQQSRGVCSIFSTVALMEHLYLKEGTIKNPDFSEQFLQWSVKVELGRFTETDGSNATYNIEAINRFGVVMESDWPYEGRGWSTANDERCTGDKKPVVCYTNGNPTDAVRNDAQRFKLPASRWISSRANSIKAHMYNTGTAVVAGMPFYYQSWSHSGGGLPSSADNRANGYITYPNDADKEVSEKKPAGHSILLVGWDDNLTVPLIDKDGQPMVDADGNPMVEKGFFLIKNSWGAGSWGSKNEFGAGYGWISYRYIAEYASVVGSAVPRLNLGAENCADDIDNNYDGLSGCEDLRSCGTAAVCNTASRVFTAKPNAAIPDNNPTGYASTLNVDSTGFATSVYVDVKLTHSFMRDIKLVVKAPSGREVTLYDRNHTGRDMQRRFFVPTLVGEDVTGAWTLTVSDNSTKDTGRLTEWSLGLGLPAQNAVEDCTDGKDNTGDGKSDCQDAACASHVACQASNPGELTELNDTVMSIPDNNPAGIKSDIVLDGPGLINAVEIDLDIRHPYRGDLVIKLTHPDGTVATLIDRKGGATANIDETVTTTAFAGKKAAGKYTLWVVDTGAGDVGTLQAWLLHVTTR
jgi:subtilisin-like proprotein convertase family protein/C1A family cysteine protease